MSAVDTYIQKITKHLEQCEDVALLDLIFKLLQKSQKA